MVDAFKPDFIAPLVGYLSSADNEQTTGSLFEVLGGWAAQTRWQRAGGYGFPTNRAYTPEDVVAKWGQITNFGEHKLVCASRWWPRLTWREIDDGRSTHPTSTQEAMQGVCGLCYFHMSWC